MNYIKDSINLATGTIEEKRIEIKKQFENIKAQEVELVSEARKKKMIYKLYLVLRYHQNQ